MGLSPQQTVELHELLWRLRAGDAAPEELARLERMVCEDPQARAFYVRYMHLCADLHWNGNVEDTGREATDFEIAEPLFAVSPLPTTHHPLPTNFVGGPVFSYLVATVVLCLMMLGAWAYKISHISTSSPETAKTERTIPPAPSFVGRISGMKDCRWSDPETQTVVGAAVALDRQYALASGLLEITYQSGARVILEGPCAYKVESHVGGFLQRGKLTARIIHQGPAASAAGAKPHETFFVKTPTAVITDLGTEFGVEVDENGDTTSHVFQGVVKVEVVDGPGSAAGAPAMLHTGESVMVSRVRETHQDSTTTKLVRFMHPTAPDEFPIFVRQMPRIATTNGSMPAMDSAEFTWKYEMDVDPAAQDLDANPGPDWKLIRGAVEVNGNGTAMLTFAGDNSGCLISGGPGDPKRETGHVWKNINNETGYTVELRVKVLETVEWYGHNLGLYFMAVDSTTEKSSIVAITNESTLWDRFSKYLIDNNRNDDDFHVFRIAQEPNSGKYHVWRDGVLVRLSDGFEPMGWNRVQFGDMGPGCGPSEVDYVRIIAGVYAPPKRMTTAPTPNSPAKAKEKVPMEH